MTIYFKVKEILDVIPSDHVLKALEKLKTIFLSSIHEHVSAAIIKSYKRRSFC